jgi:arylsulfatase
VRPWDTLSDDEKRLFTRMAEVYAGYISYYDDRLGRVLDHLEETGELDNTLIVAMSDNGASGEGGPNGSFNEWRFFNGIADTAEETFEHIDELGTPASNNHYNTGWAWAMDTPFPYWKRWAGAEGGVADMCLVAWPAKIEAKGETRDQYIHAVDVVPTIYDLLDIEPPEKINGYLQSPIEGESFAAALTDADAPGKSTQFYTMLGQRSIYHEGWLACTVHPPLSSWGRFEQDEWELFHLETDRSQTTNVAADEPAKLDELKNLWFYYAGIYNGLPLDDRSAIEQVLSERPSPAPPRERYEFFPGGSDVPESAGPRINGRSFKIAAGVDLDSDQAEGVLWAAGGVPGGHSLYIKGGRLRYTFNWVGSHLQDVVADTGIEPGAHVFAAEFSVEGPSQDPKMPGAEGTLTLYCDDKAIGSGQIVTQPGYFCLTGDGICAGRDSASAVTPEYEAPFAFTGGRLDKVVVDLSGEPYIDHESDVRAWFSID